MVANTTQSKLKRTLTFPYVAFYGLGTIIGAGIYVLIGEVAAKAGMYAPLSFLIASVIALFTALSYAELSARLPFASGVAIYVREAFNKSKFSLLVGLLVIVTGLVSASALIRGFTGYFQVFFPNLPYWIIVIGIVAVIGFIACRGIKESVGVAVLVTLIEIGGLFYILFVAKDAFLSIPGNIHQVIPPLAGFEWFAIFMGSFLAFYAFIGFEDMVNIAEEVKNPQKTIPRGIITAIVVATVLYMLVAIVAIFALPVSELAGSDAPLATIYEKTTGKAPVLISLISLFAIINGALIQIIMGSRLLYGLAAKREIPSFFGKIYSKTNTPVNGTIVITLLICVFALWFPLGTLASFTNIIMLSIFTLVNLSLIIIKRRSPKVKGVTSYPYFVPIVGMVTSGIFCIIGITSVFIL